MNMQWFDILFIMPLWAAVSAQLLLQGVLAVVNLAIAITALVKGIIPRKNFLAATLASCISALAFFSLLLVGFYVVTVKWAYGHTLDEQIAYGFVFLLSAAYIIPPMLRKIKEHWRKCMAPGQ